MAERSETAVGATTGRPRAADGQTEEASEATAQLSVEALSAELTAEADAPAGATSTAADTTPADATRAKQAAAVAAPDAEASADTQAADTEAAADAEPKPEAASEAEATPVPAAETATVKTAEAEPTAEPAKEPTAGPAAEPAADTASVGAPERHHGDRIARRYRLEECTTSNDVFSSWRAVDEKLRRAVGIHLIAAAHPRAKAVLAAARQAALLGDPRFVQVLDAVEDGDVVYVVREWLPDATGLDTLLLAEPLEAYESYQLVRQLAEALAAAHRRGLAHLRLTPACVLRTDSGQYRIDGIAVNAALRGIRAEAADTADTAPGSTAADRDAARKADAALRDTRAIGALLFASLTHRWPYPEGAHGLQGLPRDLGTVPAERVRANVHRGLSDLTARILCTPPGGRLTPITTPQELAKAVAELPKVRQPEPEPLVLPTYPSSRVPSHASAAGAPTVVTPRPPAPPRAAGAPQPALPGRSGRALKWAVSLVVLGAIALGSWGTAEALMSRNNAGSADTTLNQGGTNQHPGQGGVQRTLKQLPMSSATEFSPLDPSTIAGAKAPLAIDGNTSTSWITSSYDGYPNFGNLANRKDGSGILVDLGSVQSVSEVKVLLPFAGQTQEILAAPADATSAPSGLSGFTQRISNDQLLSGTSLDSGVLATPVRTRFVLVHVTSLPADSPGGNSYRGGISEIHILG